MPVRGRRALPRPACKSWSLNLPHRADDYHAKSFNSFLALAELRLGGLRLPRSGSAG